MSLDFDKMQLHWQKYRFHAPEFTDEEIAAIRDRNEAYVKRVEGERKISTECLNIRFNI